MNTYKEKVIALLKSQELSQEQKEKLESIFPELAESEESKDEKIRKEMLVYFKSLKGQHQLFPNEWIDFIEKQGEQNSAEWSKEDENMLDRCINAIQYELIDNGEDEKIQTDKGIKWLKSIKERVQPQPQQEWGEEDERQYRAAIAICNSLGHTNTADWLKSLRPQSTWKPSDEMLEALYRVIPENTMVISEDEMLLDKLYQGLKYGKVLSEK